MDSVRSGGGARHIYRLALEEFDRLAEAQRAAVIPHFDPCAVDRDADGRAHAVFFLSPAEVANLGDVGGKLQDAGLLADQLARFAPRKTLRKKPIPAMEALLVDEVFGTRPLPGVPCFSIGSTLAPYDEYHNYNEGVCFLRNLAAAYPAVARVGRIGFSLEGREILALRLTSQPDVPDNQKARILFTGVTHAREWVTHEVVLYFAERLASGYGVDPAITKILDKSVVWLLPAVNPDGFVHTWTTDRLWRKNRRNNLNSGCDGVDINRNFPHAWAEDETGSSSSPCGETYRGSFAASEPETQAVSELLGKERFAIAVSFHSYSQMVLHPWGYTAHVSPQSFTTLRAMARKYTSLIGAETGAAYVPGQVSYTIYLSNGDFVDHAYGDYGALAFTVEARPTRSDLGGFLLPEDQILPTCEENFAGAMWMMRNLADAMPIHHPYAPTLLDPPVPGGVCRFSPSMPTLNQQPTRSLAFPPEWIELLRTRLDDLRHFPPVWGKYDANFESLGAGRGYEYQVTDDPRTSGWPAALRAMQVMPHVFEDGAEVMLSNVAPGLNLIGVPGAHPIRLQDVQILRRRMARTADADFGYYERILEQRTALQDAASALPWINWSWRFVDSSGRVRASHPSGAGRADKLVWPFRAYEVDVNVPSWEFGSPFPGVEVYMLSFPGSSADCDGNGLLDMDDVAAGRAADCNHNFALDACEGLAPDATAFVSAILSEPPADYDACMVDLNIDGRVDGLDIQLFVNRLLAQ